MALGRADYEQIISHLQIIRTWAEVDWECGYISIINPKCCEDIVKWIDDALELLKEQEPIEAKTMEESKSHGPWWFARGACGHAIDPEDNFCRECGRKVKWDD
jgi:hypothetical protein